MNAMRMDDTCDALGAIMKRIMTIMVIFFFFATARTPAMHPKHKGPLLVCPFMFPSPLPPISSCSPLPPVRSCSTVMLSFNASCAGAAV